MSHQHQHQLVVDPNTLPATLDPPLISNFETRLLSALRAYPNRLKMWIEWGDPMRTHQKLLEMYTLLYDIAMRNDIEYFLEFGSLLGYVRHHGMIPWDYDMDIACDLENFQKWKVIGQWYEENDPVWGFKFYDDPDYIEPGYCMYLKENPNVLCDINEYVEIVGDDGVSYLKCTQPDWNYPLYRKDFIYPLKPVTTLGFRTFIPNLGVHVLDTVSDILGQCTHGEDGTLFLDNFQKNGVITNEVKWFEYDPIPFLMSKLYHPDNIEKLCTWPCIDVPEAPTIEEGFELYGVKNIPFVVRNSPLFKYSYEEFKQRLVTENVVTHAWTKDMRLVPDLQVSKALEEWEEGQLSLSFLDSPIPNLVAPENLDPKLEQYGISNETLMLILSNHDSYTAFHQDSPHGDVIGKSGGGWMYLGEGKKMWQMISFEDTIANIFDSEKKKISDLPMHELLYLNSHALWGKVYQAYCEAGDFIYVPPAMTHRVHTYAKSIGYGGYLSLPSDKERIAEIEAWYVSQGMDVTLGLFTRTIEPEELS